MKKYDDMTRMEQIDIRGSLVEAVIEELKGDTGLYSSVEDHANEIVNNSQSSYQELINVYFG